MVRAPFRMRVSRGRLEVECVARGLGIPLRVADTLTMQVDAKVATIQDQVNEIVKMLRTKAEQKGKALQPLPPLKPTPQTGPQT